MIRKYRCSQKRSDRVEERVYNGTRLDLTLDYTLSAEDPDFILDIKINKPREREKFSDDLPATLGLLIRQPRKSEPRRKGKSFDNSRHF